MRISDWSSDVCSSDLLCHRDASPDMIGSTPTLGTDSRPSIARFRDARAALFSTGCKAGSLYDDDAFGTPNGLALAYVSGVNVVSSVFVQGYENAGDRLIATLLNLKIGRDPSELQSLMRLSYAVFCLKKQN